MRSKSRCLVAAEEEGQHDRERNEEDFLKGERGREREKRASLLEIGRAHV